MEYAMRADNVYAIDTKMFGFDRYSSCFLVEGKEIALIDSGLPNQFEAVRAGIKTHGFSVNEISHIFVTHCEHPDHSGNVGNLVKENPKANVYINPVGLEYLTDPSIEEAKRRKVLPASMADRFGTMVPVPPSRIEFLNDGDVLDLGNGVRLRIIFTPGHQPSGLVILEEKTMGLFINDLVGNCFPDADYLMILTPFRSDVMQAMALLRKAMDMPVTRLFLGHFGIRDNPKELIQRSLNSMQQLMDIGSQCVAEGKPEEIASRVLAIRMPEAEKLRAARGETVYEHEGIELATSLSAAFAEYYQKLQKLRADDYENYIMEST